ncbi:hypothetical protein ACGFNF_13220 [Micromonospora sp. NPDC048868]|uniref:hypothetical protein n=1 Tax=Micromonospora sp. NPDC048868 TaxID=3364258 RepID=UPI0037231647
MRDNIWWVPLAGAGVALLGVVVGQLLSNRRETVRWRREHLRLKEQWEREDVARTHEQRRDVYVEYATEWQKYLLITERCKILDEPEPDVDALSSLYAGLIKVEIFGTKELIDSAREMFDAMKKWVFDDRSFDDELLFGKYLFLVRSDLGLREGLVRSQVYKSVSREAARKHGGQQV